MRNLGKTGLLRAGLAVLIVALFPLIGTLREASVLKKPVTLRGHTLDLYFYPARGLQNHENTKILFAPGDGGWRGAALTMAETMSTWGYDVYGLDTKTYLETFTGRATALQPAEVVQDIHRLAVSMAPQEKDKVILVGWSAGAGLMLLGAASGESTEKYLGLVTLGLSDQNALGWRWKDDLTYLTGAKPDEPMFSSLPLMGKIAPLRLAMLQSSHDEYVTAGEAQKLFQAAHDPKRFISIQAQNHRFDGNQAEFYLRLREALQWVNETP